MFHYKSCGLPNVHLKNGFSVHKTAYGEGVSIVDVEGLHKALAKKLISKPSSLTPAEFRFLRKELDLSQSVLAGIFGLSEPTIRRWESGRGGEEISKLADSQIRRLYEENLNCESSVARSIKEIVKCERNLHEIELSLSENNTWEAYEVPECA